MKDLRLELGSKSENSYWDCSKHKPFLFIRMFRHFIHLLSINTKALLNRFFTFAYYCPKSCSHTFAKHVLFIFNKCTSIIIISMEIFSESVWSKEKTLDIPRIALAFLIIERSCRFRFCIKRCKLPKRIILIFIGFPFTYN